MEDTEKKSIVTKLNEIVAAVDHVEKSGFNEYSKYHYVKAADLARAVRKELALRNVLMLTTVLDLHRGTYPAREGNMNLIDLQLGYAFQCGDTGERLPTEGWFMALGEGADKGDKASYKAMTGALKYAIRNAFLVPDEADPEADEKTDIESGKAAAKAVADGKVAASKPPERAVARDPHGRIIFSVKTVLADAGPVYRVTGFLHTIRAEMVEKCFAWPDPDQQLHKGAYVFTEEMLETFEQLCAENEITIIYATPPPANASLPTIEDVKQTVTKKNQPMLFVTWNGQSWAVFDSELFEHLKKGKGHPAQLLTTSKGNYHNVVGIAQIGMTKFEADGKTPIIQRLEQ